VFLGDPDYFNRDLARYQQTTSEGIRHWVETCLHPDRRVTLSVVPLGKRELAVQDAEPAVVQ
jgi:hypothetical protein